MKTPDGTLIKVGSLWKEMDNRLNRVVEVKGFCTLTNKVFIACDGRTTMAKASRFNGKSGGYKLIDQGPEFYGGVCSNEDIR